MMRLLTALILNLCLVSCSSSSTVPATVPSTVPSTAPTGPVVVTVHQRTARTDRLHASPISFALDFHSQEGP
jgi:hypothetical protein